MCPDQPEPEVDFAGIARALLDQPSQIEIGATITDVGVLVTILIPQDYVSFALAEQEEEPEADGPPTEDPA